MKIKIAMLATVLFSASAMTVDEAFEQMDTNKDGSVDRQEFGAYMTDILGKQRAQLDEGFKELDINKDGKIDREEAKANAALDGYFGDIDSDGDGFLSLDEIKVAIASASQRTEQQP
ncbi:EF-hand domain-containing protein [Tardiphaga sp. 215_C5_N2_1]|uniref:EF-hand domain-containing protein n=1 Tax=Tardiphaga sp. 215_C5_N2_1 TaxID=3240774 RepID=UPI003F8910DA